MGGGAPLVQGDVTVQLQVSRINGRARITEGTITFGAAGKIWPTNGLPLPAISKFGFLKYIDVLQVDGPPFDSLAVPPAPTGVEGGAGSVAAGTYKYKARIKMNEDNDSGDTGLFTGVSAAGEDVVVANPDSSVVIDAPVSSLIPNAIRPATSYIRAIYRTKLGDLTRFYSLVGITIGAGHTDITADAALGFELVAGSVNGPLFDTAARLSEVSIYRYSKSDHKLLAWTEETIAAGGPCPKRVGYNATSAIAYRFFAVGW